LHAPAEKDALNGRFSSIVDLPSTARFRIPAEETVLTEPTVDVVRNPLRRLRARLRYLYHGHSPEAVRFRLSVIALDVILIGFFLAAPFLRDRVEFLVADYVVAAVLGVDLGARALATSNFRRWLWRSALLDIIVLMTLLFPLWLANFAFLRVLKLWALVHSEFFWETVGKRWDDTRWEETSKAVATLVTFLFLATGLIYALYAGRHAKIHSFLDAFYLTVTLVTTTGLGDIVVNDAVGKLISIVIMISGVTLFVRVAGTIIRPYKVRFPCPSCGLIRHEPDAVHCKACGDLLNIPNED